MSNFCSSFPMLFLVSTLLTLASCNGANRQEPQTRALPDNRGAEESAIRAIDADWLKAVAKKDAKQSASFYADGGSLMAPGAPLATGNEAIQKAWAGLMATPGFALTFAPAKIEVSSAGDLAYEVGAYQLTMNDEKGTPQTVKAQYVVVWGKQSDGVWKALLDAPTTTK